MREFLDSVKRETEKLTEPDYRLKFEKNGDEWHVSVSISLKNYQEARKLYDGASKILFSHWHSIADKTKLG